MDIERELKDAIIRGMQRQVVPGEVNSIDNIYLEIWPIIEKIVGQTAEKVVRSLGAVFGSK